MSEHLTQPERIAKLEVELGDAEDSIERLRARVAKLEAALKQVHAHICAFGSDEDLAVIDVALSETVEA